MAWLRVVLGSTGHDLMVEEGEDTRALATGLSCLLRAGLVLTHSGTGRPDQVLPCGSAGAQVIEGDPVPQRRGWKPRAREMLRAGWEIATALFWIKDGAPVPGLHRL